MKNEEHPKDAKKPRRPGRPPGSVTLTEEMMHTIVSFIRAGAFDQSAAAAVGISPRTLRDWLERGEGRGSKSSNPLLDELAKQVGVARGQARVGAETRVYREDPKYWLTHAARTTEDEPGWTEPRIESTAGEAAEDRPLSKYSNEELDEAYFRLLGLDAADGTLAIPPCPDPSCPCPLHANYAASHPDRRDRTRWKENTG